RRPGAARRRGRHEELARDASEVAGEGEGPAPLPEDLARERQRRAREQAAADADPVTVLDPGSRVLEARELLGRRLGLALDPPARRDEVVLGRVQVRISHFGW